MTEWNLNVTLPVYQQLIDGIKTVETRAPDSTNSLKDFNNIQPGDVLIFYPVDEQFRTIPGLIPPLMYLAGDVSHYKTIEEMLQSQKLSDIFPGVESIEEAICIYHSFPCYKERIAKNGIVAIKLERRL